MAGRAYRVAIRLVGMAGRAVLDIDQRLDFMAAPGAGYIIGPGCSLMRAWIDLPLSVALDAECPVLVTGGALGSPGADLYPMLVFKTRRMRTGAEIIALVAFLAIVPVMAHYAGGAVVYPRFIAMMFLPERQNVIFGQPAPGVFVADYAIFSSLYPIVTLHTDSHAGDMLRGSRVGF